MTATNDRTPRPHLAVKGNSDADGRMEWVDVGTFTRQMNHNIVTANIIGTPRPQSGRRATPNDARAT